MKDMNLHTFAHKVEILIPKGTKNHVPGKSYLSTKPISEYKRKTKLKIAYREATHLSFIKDRFYLTVSPHASLDYAYADEMAYVSKVLDLEDLDLSNLFHLGAVRAYVSTQPTFNDVLILMGVLKDFPEFQASYIYLFNYVRHMSDRTFYVTPYTCTEFSRWVNAELWSLIEIISQDYLASSAYTRPKPFPEGYIEGLSSKFGYTPLVK